MEGEDDDEADNKEADISPCLGHQWRSHRSKMFKAKGDTSD